MTIKQKKAAFLGNYQKTLNKSLSYQGLFTYSTFKKYLLKDEEFADDVLNIEMSFVVNAEMGLLDLLSSENEKIKFLAIKEVLSSKLGKENSNLSKPDDKPKIQIETDNVEYIINK